MSDSAEFTRQLGPGETLLWTGRPAGGIRFQPSDWFVVPFSFVWASLAFSAILRTNARAAGPFIYMEVLFVVVGVYMTVGRFVHDAWRRARTRYALTNERAIIAGGGLVGTVTSVSLRSLPGLTLNERRSGLGTIVFGSEDGEGLTGAFTRNGRPQAPRFELIPRARQVYELVREAQAGQRGNR